MSAKLIQYSSRGDGTWNAGTVLTLNKVTSFKIDDNFGESVPTATIVCIKDKNVTAANEIKEGNEIRIWYTAKNSSITDPIDRVFRGFVTSVKSQGFEITISCTNYLQVLVNRAVVDPSYYAFNGTYMVTSVIQSLCSYALGVSTSVIMNYITINSSLSSVTLTNFNCKDQNVYETLINICENYDCWIHYDYIQSKIIFDKRTTTNKVIFQMRKPSYPKINGAIQVLEPIDWDTSAQNVSTKTTVIGGEWDETIVIPHTTIDNTFTLGFWTIIVNGNYAVLSQYDIQKLEVVIDYVPNYVTIDPNNYYTEAGDYTIFVYLDSNKYSDWKNRVKGGRLTMVKHVTDHTYTTNNYTAAAQLYGTRDKVVNQAGIQSLSDLVSYATNLLINWSKATKSINISYIGNKTYLGYGVDIYDNLKDTNLIYSQNNWYGIVVSSSFSWPQPTTEITISDGSIRNTNISMLINKAVTSLINNVNKIDTGTVLRSDGSKAVTNDINMTNKQLLNQTVQNVTEL